MKEIRVGIIGCGMISHRHMVIYSNIERLSYRLGFKAKVVAAAEIDGQKLKNWGEQYGIPESNLYTDYREMLKRDDLDTVDVCVHNNLHTPISIEVMKAGFDCYCEKPSAASYHDAKMMMDAAKKLGRKYHVQISSLMTMQTRKAKELIDSGKLGSLYYANIEQCAKRRRPGYDYTMFTTDFYSGRIAGHGPSIDLGIYTIGQMLFLLGLPKIKSVSGFARQAMKLKSSLITNPDGFGVEDICDGFAKMENGIGFHFTATSASHHKDYATSYLLGSGGGLEITDTDMSGGLYARLPGEPLMFGNEPDLKFYGETSGLESVAALDLPANDDEERRSDSKIMLYNDNQIMWLAYKLGILNDETRYNTPEVALQQLLFTDGIFLSESLGRSVTADEIVEMSPELYVKEQEIAGRLVKFDVEF